MTPCGVPVRNVAQPVLGRPYTVLRLSTDGLADEPTVTAGRARLRSGLSAGC